MTQKNTLWHAGFSAVEIPLPKDGTQPLYIAGYHNEWEIEGVLDLQRANALWLDAGNGGILLIGVDCVALEARTVDAIRERLADFCRESGCEDVHVFATHTHAGVDTMGLWGPVGEEGKNAAFQENMIASCVRAAKEAWENRREGRIFRGQISTGDLQRDSRDPQVYDRNLYQLRFVPEDGAGGIRMLFYAAHAESLRGDNRLLSRDYPGTMSDLIRERTGEETLFLPGAIGGLIMTRILAEPFDAVKNLRMTGERLADCALAIENGAEVPPRIERVTVPLEIPLDNPVFFYYKQKGILHNEISPGESAIGCRVVSRLSLLRLGDYVLALLPCELFPELVTGEGLRDGDPEPLAAIAAEYGVTDFRIVGLCDDELGYVPPPSNYRLNPDKPYQDFFVDENGENHYEETNSVSVHAAACIAEAFRLAMRKLVSI